jgi:predicted P-loop ATPase
MKMTKKALIEAIENDGRYRAVKVEGDAVTGVPVNEPSNYHAETNTGGRRFLGWDTELLAALVDAGKVSPEDAETYTNI